MVLVIVIAVASKSTSNLEAAICAGCGEKCLLRVLRKVEDGVDAAKVRRKVKIIFERNFLVGHVHMPDPSCASNWGGIVLFVEYMNERVAHGWMGGYSQS